MATDTSAKLIQFARRVRAGEVRSSKRSSAAPEAFPAYERLRQPLRKIFGAGGCGSLIGRTVALASAKTPWLRGLRAGPDGALEGWAELEAPGKAAVVEAEVLLLAELLGLLIVFLGPALTLSLVHDAWPSMGDADFENVML